jgi:hypothetical protein
MHRATELVSNELVDYNPAELVKEIELLREQNAAVK